MGGSGKLDAANGDGVQILSLAERPGDEPNAGEISRSLAKRDVGNGVRQAVDERGCRKLQPRAIVPQTGLGAL